MSRYLIAKKKRTRWTVVLVSISAGAEGAGLVEPRRPGGEAGGVQGEGGGATAVVVAVVCVVPVWGPPAQSVARRPFGSGESPT